MADRLTPELLWRLPVVGQPEPSPDGSFVIVPVTGYDGEADTRSTRLHRVDLTTGADRPITRPSPGIDDPRISPDGTRLAFLRKETRDGDAQVWVMPLDGGEPEPLTDAPLGVAGIRWFPDSSAMCVVATLLRDAPSADGTAALRDARKEERSSARVTEDRFYRFWSRWLTEGRIHHLWRVEADGTAADLTPDLDSWLSLQEPGGQFDISPDGAEIVFAAEATRPPYRERLQSLLFTVPAGGGDAARLTATAPGGSQSRPRYSTDGHHIVFGETEDWEWYADPVRLARFDRDTGEVERLTDGWDRSCSGWVPLDDGSIALTADDDGRHRVFRIDAAGSPPMAITRDGTAHGLRVAGDRLVLRHESISFPPRIVLLDGDGGGPSPVFDPAAPLLDGVELGEVEELRFTGGNGDEVHTWVVHPPGVGRDTPRPLLQNVHGGPHGVHDDRWHPRWNHQVFAAAGYVVAAVNFHGSTGWGYDFARSIVGAWGDLPTTDVLAATDAIIATTAIDTARMGVIGGSYGGYLVTWLTAESDRFSVAVNHAGVVDLVGQWATDATFGRGLSFGGTPWDGWDAVQRWNPITRVGGIVTPTMVVHGETDYRVVVTQGIQIYNMLQQRGIPSRLLYFPDEGHWIQQPANSIRWYREVLTWVDRWIGGGSAQS